MDCLLFEIDAPRQAALDAWTATGDRTGLDAFPAPEGWVDAHLLPMLDAAKGRGVGVFAVDHPDAEQFAKDIRPFAQAASMGILVDADAEARFADRMRRRNHHMAARTSELLAAGRCSLPLLVTGRWHAIPDVSAAWASTVPEQLEGAGVSAAAFGATGLPTVASPRHLAISTLGERRFDVWIGDTDVPPYHLQLTPPRVEVVTLRGRQDMVSDAQIWASLETQDGAERIELELPSAPQAITAMLDNGCAIRIGRSSALSRVGVPVHWQVGTAHFYANESGVAAPRAAWQGELRQEVLQPRRYTTAARPTDDGDRCMTRLRLLP